MIDIPQYKIVNIHPSPLPKYRGATPGPWQIINGETKSAVTFFQIDSLPDHGPIINQIPFEISHQETSETFYMKAFEIAASHLEQTLTDYLLEPEKLTPQNHSQKTYFPKFTKDTAQIDWTWKPQKIERFIRALYPWPVAWTIVKNQHGDSLKMRIFSATSLSNELIPITVQIEGKNKTKWTEINSYYSIQKQ
jgi:methionyl-tRNA formyltransferase